MAPQDACSYPSLEELRAVLIPTADQDRWDQGELPKATFNLEDQTVLSGCGALLQLAVVASRCFDSTTASRAVALREVLIDLLPRTLDHPYCSALRVLAGLEPGTAGRGREQRQREAGSRLGSGRDPVCPRTVRRVVKQHAWPWLLDRLIQAEIEARRGVVADQETRLPVAEASTVWLWSHPGLCQPLWSRIEAGTLDVTVLDEFAATVASDARLHDRLGSGAVHRLVAEHVGLATGLLRGNPPEALRPRLAAIASQAAAEAGLVCHDQRQLFEAQAYYRLAAELAQEAAHPLLEAYIRGSWSRKLTEMGDGTGALSCVDSARAAMRRCPSSVTSAYLANAEAEAQAELGDVDACLRALNRADETLDGKDPSEDPPWLLWLRDAHFAGWKGYCQLRLGRLEDAKALLTLAFSTWDPCYVRDRAIILINLALLHLRRDDLDECCHLALEALALAMTTNSPRLVQRLRGLRVELRPWSECSAVKALDEQMSATCWV